MNAKQAALLVVKKYPGRIPTGYWEKDGQIIINTKAIAAYAGRSEASQFIVTNNGEVIGTNPMRSKLRLEDMKKL